jgi:hypothetical protein
MTDAEMIEQRKVWRHLLQAAFAEQEARQHYLQCPTRSISAAEQRLAAEGVRVDAAIDALVYELGYHIATTTTAFTRPVEGQPIP